VEKKKQEGIAKLLYLRRVSKGAEGTMGISRSSREEYSRNRFNRGGKKDKDQ